MTANEQAELLEHIAGQVLALPGVSRTEPHIFAEAKSELAGWLNAQAKELRLSIRPPAARIADRIAPGVRIVDHRAIRVETRRRA